MTGSSCCNELGLNQSTPQECIVPAAKAHAASIRWTLWLKEQKRANCRVHDAAKKTTPQQGGGKASKFRSRDDGPPIIDGPIYSPDYWRTWQIRSKIRSRPGVEEVANLTVDGNPDLNKRGTRRRRLTQTVGIGRRASSAAGIRTSKRCVASRNEAFTMSPKYTFRPTSSFAGGGSSGTLIFASVPGSDNLLDAHHDAVIKPLLQGCPSYVAPNSARGVRISHNNPRVECGNHDKPADGLYDVDKADAFVRPSVISCSFREGKASSSESVIVGISRDTPGAIYDANIGASKASAPTTRLPPTDRFSVRTDPFVSPGPGHYEAAMERSLLGTRAAGAVSWTGPQMFTESEWCRPARPRGLRAWQGFGNRCSLEEHVDYGACLDGRCCARHSVEKRNALRVVQFLGRATRATTAANGEAADQRRRQKNRSRGVLRPLSPPQNKDDNTDDDAVAGDNMERCDEGGGIPRDLAVKCSSSPPHQAGGADISGVPGGVLSAIKGGRCGGTRNKKTPLHFASERGELSLVERLCDQGDHRNAVDERGRVPLHCAADRGYTRVVSCLLRGDDEDEDNNVPAGNGDDSDRPPRGERRGDVADPNAQDDNGRTALYLACLRGHERVVRVLLEAGADPDLVDILGKSPQDVAGQQKIYQLLQFTADVALVKSQIASFEGRRRREAQDRRRASLTSAQDELAKLKLEEERLRAALGALEKKRAAASSANKRSRKESE